MTKKIFLFFLFIFICNTLLSEETYIRDEFSTTLGIKAGTVAPMFMNNFSSGKITSPNLTWGGVGAIELDWYLNSYFRLGFSIKGMFAFDTNSTAFFMTPFSFRLSWVLSAGDWEFPIELDTGVSIIQYSSMVSFAPIIAPGFGAVWNYNKKFGFGINFKYWYTMEFLAGNKFENSSGGNFFEITLSVLSNFTTSNLGAGSGSGSEK